MKQIDPIKAIKERAEAVGYTMADVCRVADIDQSQSSRWLNGNTRPLYDTVIKLEGALAALIKARQDSLKQVTGEL